MKKIKTYDEIFYKRDIEEIPTKVEMDTTIFVVNRFGKRERLCFSDLSLNEQQAVLNECSEDELKRICLILSNGLRKFSGCAMAERYIEALHIEIKLKIKLENNLYFILYRDDKSNVIDCIIRKLSNRLSDYELRKELSEYFDSVNKNDAKKDSTIGLNFDIPTINKLTSFCMWAHIPTENFFDAFIEFSDNGIDKDKILGWINEIIEKPRERYCL